MTRVLLDRGQLTKAGADNIFAWCNEAFGSTWKWDHHWPERYCFFNFADEKHALLFILKWKTN